MRIAIGGILIAMGILVAGATGLCCFMLIANAGAITGPEAFLSMGLYAGLPLAAGIGMIIGGVSIIRGHGEDRGGPQ